MSMSNILSEVHPELIAEWSDKNLPLTPDRITYGSNKVVWWKGACGHEWKTSVKDISTTLNIYTDVTKELRQSEFEGLDSYFKSEYNKVSDE